MEKIDYLAKALSMTNEDGKKYLMWEKSEYVMGLEEVPDSNWFYIFVVYDDGSSTFKAIPYANSGCKASGFGDLEYTAVLLAYYRTNLPYFWMGNDRPNVPYIDTRKDGQILYTEEDVIRWRIEYNKVIEKYGKFTLKDPRHWRRNPSKFYVPEKTA